MKKYVAYITSIIRQVFWFCLPWIVGFYILDILEINTLSAKQILFIYMLWVIHPMVKNFILGIKSRKNYTNFSFSDGFHDAIANELMRIQFKLNQLVNNTYPCFETPKEMKNHPMTMMDFRTFVEYWQAYSAYPEIAACELLEGNEDTKNKYTLYLLAENTQLEKNSIYLSCIDGKIAYSMIAVYDTPVSNVLTDIESPQEFNLTYLNELKSKIISIEHFSHCVAHIIK